MIGYRCSEIQGGVDHSESYRVTLIKGTTRTLQNGSMGFRFAYQRTFNSPVVIGNNVNDTQFMFSSCWNYNQPIIIPNGVKNTQAMFSGCIDLCQDIFVPESVEDAYEMFRGARNMKNISVSMKTQNMRYMASELNNVDIYFRDYNGYTRPNIQAVVASSNLGPDKRKNLHFKSDYNSIFNKTDDNSVVARPITWTPMTNGFYNSDFGIYCYNNYTG